MSGHGEGWQRERSRSREIAFLVHPMGAKRREHDWEDIFCANTAATNTYRTKCITNISDAHHRAAGVPAPVAWRAALYDVREDGRPFGGETTTLAGAGCHPFGGETVTPPLCGDRRAPELGLEGKEPHVPTPAAAGPAPMSLLGDACEGCATGFRPPAGSGRIAAIRVAAGGAAATTLAATTLVATASASAVAAIAASRKPPTPVLRCATRCTGVAVTAAWHILPRDPERPTPGLSSEFLLVDCSCFA